MTAQQQTFDFADPLTASGRERRDRGMDRARQTTQRFVAEDWPDQAYAFFRRFPRDEFMTEEVREYAYANGLPRPVSERAWGAVVNRAVREGLIEQIGFGQVKNARAHSANAAIWRRV